MPSAFEPFSVSELQAIEYAFLRPSTRPEFWKKHAFWQQALAEILFAIVKGVRPRATQEQIQAALRRRVRTADLQALRTATDKQRWTDSHSNLVLAWLWLFLYGEAEPTPRTAESSPVGRRIETYLLGATKGQGRPQEVSDGAFLDPAYRGVDWAVSRSEASFELRRMVWTMRQSGESLLGLSHTKPTTAMVFVISAGPRVPTVNVSIVDGDRQALTLKKDGTTFCLENSIPVWWVYPRAFPGSVPIVEQVEKLRARTAKLPGLNEYLKDADLWAGLGGALPIPTIVSSLYCCAAIVRFIDGKREIEMFQIRSGSSDRWFQFRAPVEARNAFEEWLDRSESRRDRPGKKPPSDRRKPREGEARSE